METCIHIQSYLQWWVGGEGGGGGVVFILVELLSHLGPEAFELGPS